MNYLLAAPSSRGAAFPKIETRFPPSAAASSKIFSAVHSLVSSGDFEEFVEKSDTPFVNVKEPLSEQRVLLPSCDMPMPFGALLPLSLIFFSFSSIQNRFNHVSDPRVVVSQWRKQFASVKPSKVIAVAFLCWLKYFVG